MSQYTCRACGYDGKDWKDLAHHIQSSKKGHSRGKTWAAKILTNVEFLNQKRDMPERTPLTETEKAAKKNSVSEVSGNTRMVMTLCPKCNKVTSQALPVEYVGSPRAWRASNGALMVTCQNCTRSR